MNKVGLMQSVDIGYPVSNKDLLEKNVYKYYNVEK